MTLEGLPVELLRRFRPTRELGRGGCGVVYLVDDAVEPPSPKALKLVQRSQHDPRRRLLRGEFGVLRELRHPGLVRVFDFGEHRPAGIVWFTSEFVPGSDLFEGSSAFAPSELEAALATLSETLQFLHERHVLHNDIKPSNVRLPGGPRSARLLDFGLATQLGRGSGSGGTPTYMAPERLSGSVAGTVRSDLYSLGALFYRCATRRFPFAGEEPGTLLSSMAAGLVPPRVLRPDLPHYLDEILVRLLSPAPEARYASATELLADLGRARRAPVPGSREPPSPLPGPPLLDRDAILADLRREAGAAFRGEGPARKLVMGDAGIGKSRLLDELRQILELDGFAVVAARGQPGPARAWNLVREIARGLAALPVAPPLPDGLAALLAPSHEDSEPRQLEVAEAFGQHVLACAETVPLALLVDDLPWGDDRSTAAIVGLARSRPDRARLAIVAAARDDGDAVPAITEWRAVGLPSLRLPALCDDAQRALLASLFPGVEIPERLVADAVALAAGSPLVLEEIGRNWVEAGAAKRAGGAWRFSDKASIPPGSKALDLIAGRLRRLDPGSTRLVRLVALRGGPLVPGALARLAPGSDTALDELERARFLTRAPDGIDVAHPLVREAALSALPDPDARVLHLALAGALLDEGAGSEDLWAHLLRGGDTARGVRHARAAGRRAEAMEDYASGRAILEEARRALETQPEALDPSGTLRLLESLAVCLDETGAFRDAMRLLEKALPLASKEARPGLLVRLGRVLVRLGEVSRAEEILRRAVEESPGPAELVDATTSHSNALHNLGQWEESHQRLLACAAAAEVLETDPRHAVRLARFHIQMAVDRDVAGTGIKDVLSSMDAAVRAAERSGLQHLRAYTRSHRAFYMTLAGDPGSAAEDLAEAARVAEGGAPVRWRIVCVHQGLAAHHRGESRAALRWIDVAFGGGTSRQMPFSPMAEFVRIEVLADIGDPRAIDLALESAQAVAGGAPNHALAEMFEAGMRCALWLGRSADARRLEGLLDVIAPVRFGPNDRKQLAAARGMAALLEDRPGDAAASLREACSLAERFAPLYVPRWSFHLAYALALLGRKEEALRAASEAGAGYGRLGNQAERARAVALAAAISEGRLERPPSGAEWLARVAAAAESAAEMENEPRALADAVARAAHATGVWLFGAGPDGEPALLASAGPCAAAEPLAWSDEVARAFAEGAGARRPGVGLVMPVQVGGERGGALVVEDRTWPQSFSVEAAAAVEMTAARVLADMRSRRLESDLDAARRALADARTQPSPSRREGRTRTTVMSRAPTMTRSSLVDLTVGSVELRHAFEGIIGRSESMRRALKLIDRAVGLDSNVLLVGETGTGKELAARALHEQGPRSAGPFVAVNCAAVPRTLAESELFGHVPGAFTGAGRVRHRGTFEQASGGTLLLDEVAELDLPVQAKLLRAIEEREIRPVGSERAVPVDIRIVAATNRDLQEEVRGGSFRADLLYRLAVIEIRLPPLRERSDDIPLLVKHLLGEMKDPAPEVSPETLDALCAYPWPGNVRELANQLERAVAFCGEGPIRPEHLAANVRASLSPRAAPRAGKPATLRRAIDDLERRLIAEALRQSGGRKGAAARALGVTPVGLNLKIRRLGLSPDRGRRASRP